MKIIIGEFEIKLNKNNEDMTLIEAYESVLLKQQMIKIESMLYKRYGRETLNEKEFMHETGFGKSKMQDAKNIYKIMSDVFPVSTVATIVTMEDFNNDRDEILNAL